MHDIHHKNLLKKAKVCRFYVFLMHKYRVVVQFSSFFAQKICKCEIKFVTLHPIFKTEHIINILNIRNYVRN